MWRRSGFYLLFHSFSFLHFSSSISFFVCRRKHQSGCLLTHTPLCIHFYVQRTIAEHDLSVYILEVEYITSIFPLKAKSINKPKKISVRRKSVNSERNQIYCSNHQVICTCFMRLHSTDFTLTMRSAEWVSHITQMNR